MWNTTWKVSVFGDFLVCIFPHSEWIGRDTECLSVFSPNTGKYGPKKLICQTKKQIILQTLHLWLSLRPFLKKIKCVKTRCNVFSMFYLNLFNFIYFNFYCHDHESGGDTIDFESKNFLMVFAYEKSFERK